jgi:uncharacterized protein
MHRSTNNTSVPVIWRLLDGRPGHENQVRGLTEAIARRISVQYCDIVIDHSLRGLRSLIPGRVSFADSLPVPDLLVGAGHSTHVPMLIWQKRFGGKAVVVMKPSLPTTLFDLCLIPAHDNLRFETRNVVRTEGSLNRIRPSADHDPQRGLILIGGPSKHFLWSDEAVTTQLLKILRRDSRSWTVATSVRTPDSFVQSWRTHSPDVPLVTSLERSSRWLPEQLAERGAVWVTCDSMSMIYEALTAGSRVGLLELRATRHGRISRNIRRLTDLGLTTTSSQWLAGRELPVPTNHYSESDRCSLMVVERCLNSGGELLSRKFAPDFRPKQSSIENGERYLGELTGLIHSCIGLGKPVRHQ